jgi:hypothetical protein
MEISFLDDNVPSDDHGSMTLLILPTAGLPTCAGYGYTFCFWSKSVSSSSQPQPHIGHKIWQYMISEQCPDGPIEIGTLEYDTLRIECGQPLYRREMTATLTKPKSTTTSSSSTSDNSSSTGSATAAATPASPLELGLDSTIDLSKQKGCYQGQEGIASILKNPRGPPRTLYQVIFEDDINIYDYQSEGEYTSTSSKKQKENVENLTRTPLPNDVLYVLGSNEQIMVGRITSVAEPSGTGEPITMALALIRRADSIQSSMKQMGIDLPSRDMFLPTPTNNNDDNNNSDNGSILITPPPLDVLDGLEVIIGGTYTIGKLRMIPSRRSSRGRQPQLLFSDEDIPTFVQNLPSEQDMYDLVPLTKFSKDNNDTRRSSIALDSPTPTTVDRSTMIQNAVIVEPPDNINVRPQSIVENWEDAYNNLEEEVVENDEVGDDYNVEQKALERAIMEAEEAAKEAERKAAKLELLRQRAEEAILRRKQKQQQQQEQE